MILSLPPIQSKVLTVNASWEPSKITLAMSGAADMRAERDFDRLMNQVDKHARERRVREVLVDIRELEFINSGCLKVFVSWISDVRELDKHKQYRIAFQSDKSVDWQRRSLSSLKCFGEEVVELL